MQRSTHSKYSLIQVNVKKRQEICRNFQELRFTYSHFQFNWKFPKLDKKGKNEKKNIPLEAVFTGKQLSFLIKLQA